MHKKEQQFIIAYPDDFPISGALREVFTARPQTFFESGIWLCELCTMKISI